MSTVAITFEGRGIEAEEGETLAAALAANRIRVLRTTRSGAERGIFCGMGVCQDCLVEIDGKPNQRACMTKVERPMSIERGSDTRVARPTRTGAPTTIDAVPVVEPEILVVGGGPAGLAAAIAARCAGAEVVLIDERSSLGGQYYKQLAADHGVPADGQHRQGARLIQDALRLGVEVRLGTTVWGAFLPNELVAGANGTIVRFQPQRLILATGAYERAVPIPGWTLPGVMTTGAAQTLWRTARRLPGRRVLIAGNGPLNLQLASELLSGGVKPVAVVEAAAPFARKPAALLRMATASPRLVTEGLRHWARLLKAGAPLIHGSVIRRIDSGAGGLNVNLARIDGGGETTFRDLDAVCLGYGFEPSNELLRALDAQHEFDAAHGYLVPRRDRDGRTSVRTIFAVGDCTGLGGAAAALAEGTIAGASAAADLASSGMIDPATSLLLADAVRRARQAGPSELGLAESDLTRALRATLDEPGFRTELAENEGASELVGEVEAASHQVYLARKFYNDLAGRTLDDRRRPLARVLHLSGTARAPEFFDIDDALVDGDRNN